MSGDVPGMWWYDLGCHYEHKYNPNSILDSVVSYPSTAGCSAGAMILAKRLPNFRNMGIGAIDGFGIAPADYVMPHFDHAGPFKALVSLLRRQMKDGQSMIGIDENTALIGKLGGEWKAMGVSKVHVMTHKRAPVYGAGKFFR